MYHGNLQTRGWPGRQGQKKFDESGENGKLFTIHNLRAEITISHFRGIQSLSKKPWVPLGWLLSLMMRGHGFTYCLQQSTPNIFQERKHFSLAAPEQLIEVSAKRVNDLLKELAVLKNIEPQSMSCFWSAPPAEAWRGEASKQGGRQRWAAVCWQRRGMFTQSKLKGGQQTNHGVRLL